MFRSIDVEDRNWNMERFENRVDQAPLLPGGVVGAAQRNQNVIGPEGTNRVFEGVRGASSPTCVSAFA